MTLSSSRPIYLTGFMGSGKSTVGLELARLMKRRFLDTDALIEKNTGKKISQLFKKGEKYFRDLETATLVSLAGTKNTVISLGGGAVLRPENRQLIARGHWIYLDVPLSVILTRILGCKTRPLAKSAQDLGLLYQARLPLYLMATHIIRCTTLAPDAIAKNIMRRIKK